MRDRILSSVLLPGAVAPDDADDLAVRDVERHVAQRPEPLDGASGCRGAERSRGAATASTSASRIVRYRARAPSWYCLPSAARESPSASRQRSTRGCVESAASDDIGERALHAPEEERAADQQRDAPQRGHERSSGPGACAVPSSAQRNPSTTPTIGLSA